MESGKAVPTIGDSDIVSVKHLAHPILLHDTCNHHGANQASESWLPAIHHHPLANATSFNELPLVQPLPFATLNLSGCHINCHTISSLRNVLKSGTLLLCLNLSNNQIGKGGMKELARALNDPCFAHLKRLDVRHNRHDGIKPLTSALTVMKHKCLDGNSYKSPFFRIGWVCKRCGIQKAKHTTTRMLEHLEEFSFSVCNTAYQDIMALGKAISQGALPSLEKVNLDDGGPLLDLGGHMTCAIEFLMQTVAEKGATSATSAMFAARNHETPERARARALPDGIVQHPTARSPPARTVAMGVGIASTTSQHAPATCRPTSSRPALCLPCAASKATPSG